MTGEQRGRKPAAYQIRVRGHLGPAMRRAFPAGPAMRRAFPALQAEAQARDTVLRGVTDQAALYGALARIEELGLELLEVRRVNDAPR